MSNSVLQVRVETMEMGSKGLFCFPRALNFLIPHFQNERGGVPDHGRRDYA